MIGIETWQPSQRSYIYGMTGEILIIWAFGKVLFLKV